MRKVVLTLFMIAAVGLAAGNAFVLNSNSQTLSKIDLETGDVDNEFAILGQYAASAPNKLEITDNLAIVTVTYENSVQTIDLETGETISFIALDDSSMPNDLAIYDGNAFISGNGNSSLYKVNYITEEVIATASVGLAPQGVEAINGNIWVANTGFDINTYQYEPGTISVINPDDMSLVATISTALNPADMIQIDELVYVVCTGNYGDTAGQVTVVDATSFEIIETIAIGGAPASISSNDNKLYMGNSWPAGVYVYDLATASVESTPDDAIFVGGNSVNSFEGLLAVIDAVDYIENSIVRFYNPASHELIADYEVAVGATDIKFSGSYNSSDDTELVVDLGLSNYPNPFNISALNRKSSSTTICYKLPDSAQVNVDVYNIKGEKIAQIFDGYQAAGKQQLSWNGIDKNHKQVAAGVYLYKLQSGSYQAIQRMVIIK